MIRSIFSSCMGVKNSKSQFKIHSEISGASSFSKVNDVRSAAKVHSLRHVGSQQLDCLDLNENTKSADVVQERIASYEKVLFQKEFIKKEDVLMTELVSAGILSAFGSPSDNNHCIAFVVFKSKGDEYLWVLRKCLKDATQHSILALESSIWVDPFGVQFKLYGGGEIHCIQNEWYLYPKSGSLSATGGLLEVVALNQNVKKLAEISHVNYMQFQQEKKDENDVPNWMPSDKALQGLGLICLKQLYLTLKKGEDHNRSTQACEIKEGGLICFEKTVVESEYIAKLEMVDIKSLGLDDEIIMIIDDFKSFVQKYKFDNQTSDSTCLFHKYKNVLAEALSRIQSSD